MNTLDRLEQDDEAFNHDSLAISVSPTITTVSTTDTKSRIGSNWIQDSQRELQQFEEMKEIEKSKVVEFRFSKREPKNNRLKLGIIFIIFLLIGGVGFATLALVSKQEEEVLEEPPPTLEPFKSTDLDEISLICDNFLNTAEVNAQTGLQFGVCIGNSVELCNAETDGLGTDRFNCRDNGFISCLCNNGDFIDIRRLTETQNIDFCISEVDFDICNILLDNDENIDLRKLLITSTTTPTTIIEPQF